jgi:hypothetical protein
MKENNSLKRANKFFGKVTKFIYLQITATDQNYSDGEVWDRLNSGNDNIPFSI